MTVKSNRRVWVAPGDCEVVTGEVVSDPLVCEDPSLALQSAREETDINTIVKRFGITGQLPQGLRLPTYQDFLDAPDDYRGALHAVREAEASFMKLPAAIRARFENDPHLFVSFCSDPSNLADLREMGLAPKEPSKPASPAGDSPTP